LEQRRGRHLEQRRERYLDGLWVVLLGRKLFDKHRCRRDWNKDTFEPVQLLQQESQLHLLEANGVVPREVTEFGKVTALVKPEQP
jgi:hypothetical protein